MIATTPHGGLGVHVHLVKIPETEPMKTLWRSAQHFYRIAANSWLRFAVILSGALALLWFLARVIPKPSRASYPCQRAAYPLASGFVVWLCGLLAIRSWAGWLGRGLGRYRMATNCLAALTVLAMAGWTWISYPGDGGAAAASRTTDWKFVPAQPNEPVGDARGIHPGRVVWAHDPQATRWAGNWKQKSDQWWLDVNTDQSRVDAMLDATLLQLTGTAKAEEAWQAIFEYYNKNSRQMDKRGHRPGEVVAVKINLNCSDDGAKTDNYIDASPQMALAMVRQLVKHAGVPQQDIVVYDARKAIPAYMLKKVWSEFKDVRFVQASGPKSTQPKNPGYGDYHGLETAQWVEGVSYSNGKYKDAKLIPKQVHAATYLVNLALLKAHSYPYNTMEDGDSGQTGVTLCGKNHFGSIKGTAELHAAINTDQEGVKNAYSPMVDLAASPNLGAKTILFVLDGLYCGRKWRSYPQHFPAAPFGNRVEPYENRDWPASILASMDGVALDSVGLDILFAQTKNNNDSQGRSRILIRANADDYLFEMARPDHAPSGMAYMQGGKAVSSLGVHERWDSDEPRRSSRNLDPVKGKGIELVSLPPDKLPKPAPSTVMPADDTAPATNKAEESVSDKSKKPFVPPFDAVAAGLKPLFDGKTLKGWVGDPQCWKVEDGAIVGVKGNQNIMTVDDYDDFRLIVSSIQVKEPSNHQGVGFWGKRLPEGTWGYGGCLLVMPPMPWMWDYTRNGSQVGKMTVSKNVEKELGVKRSQWTQAEILVNRAKGSVRMAVNGIEVMNYIDSDPARWRKGPIGLQAHGGNKEVRYKDVFIEVSPKEDRLITLKK
jgi:hypothetical protein